MIMKRFPKSARLATATVTAVVLLVGGSVAVMSSAEAQTAAYPDAANTGVPAGTSLQNATGTVVITQDNYVYENKNLTGCMVIQANDVIIRNSRITGNNCGYSVISNQGLRLRVEDTDIACQAIPGTNALTYGNYTVRRVDIQKCENGLWAASNTIIEDSYIHDLIPYASWRAQDPHTDGIQIGEGNNGITIRHNRVYGDYSLGDFGNSALTSNTGNSNVLIENNIFAGGGYTVRCEGSGSNNNYRVINNRFSTIFTPKVGGFGPVNMCSQNATQYAGNVYHETGQLLPGQTQLAAPQPPSALQVDP